MGLFTSRQENRASMEQKKRNVQKHLRIANAIAAKFPGDPAHNEEYASHVAQAEKLIKRYKFNPLQPVSSKEYALKYR